MEWWKHWFSQNFTPSHLLCWLTQSAGTGGFLWGQRSDDLMRVFWIWFQTLLQNIFSSMKTNPPLYLSSLQWTEVHFIHPIFSPSERWVTRVCLVWTEAALTAARELFSKVSFSRTLESSLLSGFRHGRQLSDCLMNSKWSHFWLLKLTSDKN